MVESLKDDIAELKETQFQVKVHEKEIQLITEVRSTVTLSGLGLVALLLRDDDADHNDDVNDRWVQLIANGWEVAYNNGTVVGGRRSIIFRRKLH